MQKCHAKQLYSYLATRRRCLPGPFVGKGALSVRKIVLVKPSTVDDFQRAISFFKCLFTFITKNGIKSL